MSVKNKFPIRIGFFLLVAVLVAGCAPIVRMTIEHRDITGGLIGRYVLTPSSSEVVIPNYQRSQTLDAFVEAESSDGLESSIIIGEGTCWGGTGGAGTVSSPSFTLPTSGNAIPPNQNPTKFSYRERLDPTCAGASMEWRIYAKATSLPSKSGGSATATTAAVVVKR